MTTSFSCFGGMIIVVLALAQEPFAGEISKRRCELRCKLKLDGALGKQRSFVEAKLENGCFCFDHLKKGRHRKPRSADARNDSAAEITPSTNPDAKKNKTVQGLSGQIKKTDENNNYKHCSAIAKYKHKNYTGGEPSSQQIEPGDIDLQSINVTFVKGDYWLANVTWAPPKENSTSVTGYIVMWHSSGSRDPFIRCRELPKNEVLTVLDRKDGWLFPDDLYVAIIPLPRREFWKTNRDLKSFSPIAIQEMVPLSHNLESVKKKGNNTLMQHWSIVAGVLAGAVIFGSLIIIYRRKKRPLLIEVIEETIIKNKESKTQNIDTYFASYLPESEKYSNEVATIAYKLGTMGYKVVFDQIDSVRVNEKGFNMWVDEQILAAKKYIVFCSPGYVRLWQSLVTNAPDNKLSHVNKEDLVRVRYEIKRISDVYSENCSTSRIVCIKTDPKMSTKLLPPWMNHNMLLWPEEKQDIIRQLNDQTVMIMHI